MNAVDATKAAQAICCPLSAPAASTLLHIPHHVELTPMHIRQRNKVIQLIRTVYDNESKKGRAVLVGHMAVKNPELSADLKSQLTDDEKKQVVAWLASRNAQTNLAREYAARTLTEQLAQARAWFKTQGTSADAKALAQDVASSANKLIRQLRSQNLLTIKEKTDSKPAEQAGVPAKAPAATESASAAAASAEGTSTFRAPKKSKSKKSR